MEADALKKKVVEMEHKQDVFKQENILKVKSMENLLQNLKKELENVKKGETNKMNIPVMFNNLMGSLTRAKNIILA